MFRVGMIPLRRIDEILWTKKNVVTFWYQASSWRSEGCQEKKAFCKNVGVATWQLWLWLCYKKAWTFRVLSLPLVFNLLLIHNFSLEDCWHSDVLMIKHNRFRELHQLFFLNLFWLLHWKPAYSSKCRGTNFGPNLDNI